MRIVSIAAAIAAALIPTAASAADYHTPRPAPRRQQVQHHYAPPMPVYREVALPTIAPPKPLYYVPSPVYYVQHLDQGGCNPCGGGYHAAPGRWIRHSHWPF